MSKASDTIERVKSAYTSELDAVEAKSEEKWFPDYIGVSDLNEFLTDIFDNTEPDTQYAAQYFTEDPDRLKLIGYRQQLAYLSLGAQFFKYHYLSGSDNHVMTDVDMMRTRPHTVLNGICMIPDTKMMLEDKNA